MSRPRCIRFVELDTGEESDCCRDEVAPSIVDELRPLVERAVGSAGEHVALPDVFAPPCTITAVRSRDGGLIVNVWQPQRHGQPWPLAVIVIAPSALASADLWRTVVPRAPGEMAPPPQAPKPPWCAARPMLGIEQCPEAASWLGEVERCLAWAWIDRG